LLKCRDKVAISEQSVRYTFAEIERFAKNCAALILKRNAAVKRPVTVFLSKSEQMLVEQVTFARVATGRWFHPVRQ